MAGTLRTLAGLTTDEIARAFLVSTQTMAQRLARTKRKIRDANIPYRVPPAHLLPATRADLLRRLGRHREAAEAYREALALARTDADRRFLARRLDEIPR